MMETLVADVLLPAAIFALMFGMGLTLTSGDFRRIADAPAATILGTLLQLVIMPMVGIALALAFDLPPLLAAGLVVIAACPGGMFSNMYVHLARANTVLSVTLTATATMVTLLTLPLWVRAVLDLLGSGANEIDVPVLATALELGGLTVAPILIGMATRRRWPHALRLESWFTRGAAGVILAALTYDAFQRPELPLAELESSWLPVLWLLVAALALGLGVPALLRIPLRDATTIAVELIVKNALLGLVLARRSLEFDATIPILIFATFQTPLGIGLLVGWRGLARRQRASPATEDPPEARSSPKDA